MRKVTRNNKKSIYFILISAIAFVAVIAGFLITKYTPSKKTMSGYQYFGIPEDEQKSLVILDDQPYEKVEYIDGRYYISQKFVENNINVRFYYDKEYNAVLYTDNSGTKIFYPDMKSYKDENNETVSENYEFVKSIDGEIYIDFEMVAVKSNINYVYADEPHRIIINTKHDTVSYIDVTKKSQVRYRVGIKSPVLASVNKGESLKYIEKVDEKWTKVETASGLTGYIKSNAIGDVYDVVLEDTYKEGYSPNLKNYKINMSWYQMGQIAANYNIDNYLTGVSGVNVLSPTWFSIGSETGDLVSVALKDVVDDMHGRGIDVWPLVDDFNKEIDYAAFYSSMTARTTFINNLMQQAKTYGFDGINMDCEFVKKDFANDYLQFLRELSFACRNNGLILSVDNYKPESFNSHYRLDEQAHFVDYIIIMGYDEHYNGSEAGSVASLPFVKEGIEQTVSMVPSAQVINAIPFYTRIWTIKDGETKGKAAGMQASIDEMNNNGATCTWNDETQQYYTEYETSEGQVKIWFEEERSITEKMKLYSEYQLGGVAEWKLGLQKNAVWNIIDSAMKY